MFPIPNVQSDAFRCPMQLLVIPCFNRGNKTEIILYRTYYNLDWDLLYGICYMEFFSLIMLMPMHRSVPRQDRAGVERGASPAQVLP